MARPAVFVDRDGTLIEDVDYLTSADQIRFLPQAIPALKKLHEAGYAIVLVTNQSGVARGMLTEIELRAIHLALVDQVEMLGGHIDGVYYCPHLPSAEAAREPQAVPRYVKDCLCRKPKPGLFLQARDELGLDLDRSFAVGDAWRDVEAALAVGIPSVKVPRPRSRQERRRSDLPVLAEAESLGRAAEVILKADVEEAHDRVRRARSAAATASPVVTVKKPAEAIEARPAAKADATPPEAKPRATSKQVQELKLEFDAPSTPVAPPAATPEEPSDIDEPEADEPDAPAGLGLMVEPADSAEEEIEPQYDASLAPSPLLDRLMREEQFENEAKEAGVVTVGARPTAAESEPAAEENIEEDVGDMIEEEEHRAGSGAVETLVEERREPPAAEDVEAETMDSPGPETDAVAPATCGRCGAEIEPADLTTGQAGAVYETLLCRQCYPEVSRMSERAAARAAEVRLAPSGTGDRGATLDDLLAELRLLRNPAPPSDGLPWPRMIGTVAQVLAVAMAVLPPIIRNSLSETMVWLLAAIFVQLVALTMFLIARKKE